MSTVFLAILMFSVVANVYACTNLYEERELDSMGFSGYETINPNSLAYPLKRIGEKIYTTILSQEKEQEFFNKVYDRRFRELVYIINSEKTGFLVETTNRYNTTVGGIKAMEDASSLQNDFRTNIIILENLRDRYEANSTYWMLIQQAIDTTNSVTI